MNERRRTLLFNTSNAIKNGVYIESVEHEFYLTDDWDSKNKANSIAVVTNECKFRVGLTEYTNIAMNEQPKDWSPYLSGTTDSAVAKTDYNGAANTKLIVTKCQSATKYAAGWCNAYTFPDGTTKGYLPALGELNLAYQNKAAIDAALSKCGGESFSNTYRHWSSTLNSTTSYTTWFWTVYFYNGKVRYEPITYGSNYARPFAPLEDSN